MTRVVDVDYLIIGSGIAGFYLADQLAGEGEVLVITKEKSFDANTFYAQGGVASVIEESDSYESHIADTLDAGAGLCNREAVEVLVREGPEHIRRLMELGAGFEVDEQGRLKLGREGGHSANRIVHSRDLTGQAIHRVLERSVRAKQVQILENHSAVEIITRYHLQNGNPQQEPPHCYGAYVYNRETWEIFIVRARATIIATGGAGQVYLNNTNPEVASGDGVALGYRAGAKIVNMEFYQFHPTTLYSPGHPNFLISEAVRGAGALLRDVEGKTFMDRYDSRRELAPRDIVARAIDAEMKRTGAHHLWLDATVIGESELKENFPTIYAKCLERGIDITKQWIPVVPAAHYMCGGVDTDLNGETSVRGLFASGEAAHTGVHGGNRLASNSLLEGLVFSHRIAEELKRRKAEERPAVSIKPWSKEGVKNLEEWVLVQHNFEALKRLMHNYVGIVRSDLRLDRALRRINLLSEEVEDFYRRTEIQNKILELRNMICVARLIVISAMNRKESRGLHFTLDYPEDRSPSNQYTIIQRGAGQSYHFE